LSWSPAIALPWADWNGTPHWGSRRSAAAWAGRAPDWLNYSADRRRPPPSRPDRPPVTRKLDQQRKPRRIRSRRLFQDFREHRKAETLQGFANLLFQRKTLRGRQDAQGFRQTPDIGFDSFAVPSRQVHQLAECFRQDCGAPRQLELAGEGGHCSP